MNKKQWQQKRYPKYVGYSLNYQTFTWNSIRSISYPYIRISPSLKKVYAFFEMSFNNGDTIKSEEIELDPIYEKVGIFFKTDKLVENIQLYFDRRCENLQKVYTNRTKAEKAFLHFKRYQLTK